MLIYGLFDPRDGQLRYIGKSSSGLRRPRMHSCPSVLARERCHRSSWIKALLGAGVRPEIRILEEHDSEANLNSAEVRLIAFHRSIGARLTNMTDGGEGATGAKKSEETRAKLSVALRGKNSCQSAAQRAASLKNLEIAAMAPRYLTDSELMDRAERKRRQWMDPECRSRFLESMGSRKVIDHRGKIFGTANDAAKYYGCSSGRISDVLSGKRPHWRGFRFAYVNGEDRSAWVVWATKEWVKYCCLKSIRGSAYAGPRSKNAVADADVEV